MLDPITVLLVATAFMLLNGAVLGFIHRALPHELRAAAADWRIGTLLIAAGALLGASRGIRAVDWIIPLTNAAVFWGFALYWRALRRYFDNADSRWVFALPAFGVLAITFFTFVVPHFSIRVAVATIVLAATCAAASATLLHAQREHRSVSGTVLVAILLLVTLLVLLRGVYYLINSSSNDTLLAPNSIAAAISPFILAMLPVMGTTAFVLLCFERIRRDLHRIATTDALTGLANRRTMNERADQMFVRARASNETFSVAVIDIDHFKQINDRHGHDAGDQVLIAVAHALERNCRGKESVGRHGGEEFVVMLDGAAQVEALAAAERLRGVIEQLEHANLPVAVRTTVSIGVATLQSDDASFDDVLRRADRALYAAKAAGRNCVRH
jgi:diguanylate cyclase (GGDEF)-like protein